MQAGEAGRPKAAADVVTCGLIAGLGIALAGTGYSIRQIWPGTEDSAIPHSFEPIMGLTASVLGLAMLAWWCLALLVAVAGQVLHQAGHISLGSRVSNLSPAFMRRLVLVVLSLNLVSAPMATAQAPHDHVSSSAPITELRQPEALAERLPGRHAGITGAAWQPTQSTDSKEISPRWKPRKAGISTGPMIGDVQRQQATLPNDGTVTVTPGDSLWSIVSEHLGPYATDVEVATEWPRWYAANKQTIGPDPGLLLPGQVLTTP